MILFLRPGEQLMKFNLYRKESVKDEKGRVIFSPEIFPIDVVYGSLSKASQKEMDRWQQIEHPITHTIVLEGTSKTQAEDVLEYNNEKYLVQGKINPGGINAFEIIYCNQSKGVNL